MDIHDVHNYLPTNTFFKFGVNMDFVKSLEKFFPTRTYYYIRALLSILFIKVFLLDTEQT